MLKLEMVQWWRSASSSLPRLLLLGYVFFPKMFCTSNTTAFIIIVVSDRDKTIIKNTQNPEGDDSGRMCNSNRYRFREFSHRLGMCFCHYLGYGYYCASTIRKCFKFMSRFTAIVTDRMSFEIINISRLETRRFMPAAPLGVYAFAMPSTFFDFFVVKMKNFVKTPPLFCRVLCRGWVA